MDDIAAPVTPDSPAGSTQAAAAPTPLTLPRQRALPSVAIIDVDTIAIGASGTVDRHRALADLDRLHRRTASADLNLAVVSASVAAALGQQIWFRYPRWTVRLADTGKDAADRQLIDFACAAVATRRRCVVTVVSGDGIFADLADVPGVAAVETVVPPGYRGLSHRLRPYLATVTRAAHRLAA